MLEWGTYFFKRVEMFFFSRRSPLSKINREDFKIFVVRPDHIGDVILSTPVFQAIKKHHPQANLTIFVQQMVAPLVQGLPCVDHCMIFDPSGRHRGILGFFRLVKEIRKERFAIAVVLQSHRKIAAALFFAQVGCRIGPWSKLHSFLFYSEGIRQRRSRVQMHEADYNLQLLRSLQINIPSRSILTQVSISSEVRQKAQSLLQQKGWTAEKKLIVVHPGMRGSALNWPQSHYEDLILALLQDQNQVLVSGGPGDFEVLSRIRTNLQQQPWFYCGEEPIDFLGGLFCVSDLVVVGGTGPLHLAVALGRNVLTFHSPILVQSAKRWGPYAKQGRTLTPEVYCGQVFRCLGSRCRNYPCMSEVSVSQALQAARELLGVRVSL
jgi:heptosyltransferase-2